MDAATPTETPEISLHFLDYWRVIRLRKSLILTVFLLCVISTAFLTYLLPNQYSSTVRIEVQKDTPEVSVLEARQVSGWDPYYLTTQFKIIKSWAILMPVITNMDLQHVLARQAGEQEWTRDQTFAALSKRVNVDQTRGTSLIEITVTSSKPELAADIANEVAETYKKLRLEQWKSSRGAGIESMQDELETNAASLTAEQSNLDALRIKLQISELDDNSPMVNATLQSETIKALEMRRIESKFDYTDHNNTLTNLLTCLATNNNLLPQALVTAYGRQLDPELLLDADRVQQTQAAFTAASESGYDFNNPKWIAAKKASDDAAKAYADKIQGILAGLQIVVAHDKGLLDTIESEETKAKDESRRDAATNSQYFALKRTVENDRRNLEDMQRRLEAEKVERNQPLGNTVVVYDPARADKIPVFPKPMYIIPIGILVGLIVGVGLAFFIEYLDTSVKTIDDVERSLQAPVLGVIPQNVGNLMEDGPESPHAEAYRVLRTNLLFARKNEGWNTMTVLSGGAGEGKTTTLFNLATIFAQNGQRILVVDSDLRRPSVHRMLRANNTTGLTDLLLNKQVTLDQVIQKTKLPTLDFLPSGKLPSSSMSILGSSQMKDTIRELKHRYDFVFFDSPPLLGVSDASILASEVDMVLQVIQYRRYPQPMTLRAKQMIQKVGGNLMGLVLNNINMSQDENYYYYSGYYEYEYRSQQKDATVVQLSDAAAKAGKSEIKKKY